MADPLSVSAGIVALLQLASSVVQYLKAVRDASHERQRLITEIGSVTGFLYLLNDSVDTQHPNNTHFATYKSLCITNGPLHQIEDALNELAAKLRPAHGGIRRTGKALLWPFQKGEINGILHKIERQKTMIGLILQNDNNEFTRIMAEDLNGIREDLTSVHTVVRNMESVAVEQEREKLLEWISPLDFRAKHRDVLSRHHPGTGEWIFDSSEFIGWRQGSSKLLWCTGIPGAGKTVLTSVIIDHLERDLVTDSSSALVYVYCSYQDPDHTPLNLIASVLRQLVHHHTEIPQRVEHIYKTHLAKSTRLDLEELLVEIKLVSQPFTNVYVVIDALDECSEDIGNRSSFLEAIQALEGHVRMLITSRTSVNIVHYLLSATRLEVDARDSDVVKYVESRLASERRLQRNVAGHPELQATIVSTVLRSTKGMFLLAKLHVDSLAKKHNRREIRVAVECLPTELYGTYDEVFKRIMSQEEEDVELAKSVLLWVVYRARPLTILELQHALAVHTGTSDFDNDDLIDEEILVSVCLGIVAIEPESGLVRLIHYTARDYLIKHPIQELLDARAKMAKTCLTYLGYEEFSSGYCKNHQQLAARLEKYPFYWYAARWWGVHMARIKDLEVLNQALRFLVDKPRLRAAGELMYNFDDGLSRYYPKNFEGLHILAKFGLRWPFKWLLERTSSDFNLQDEYGQTPLSVASREGHLSMLDYLLGLLTIDVDAGNSSLCGTALHAAVRGGHLSIIEKLLNAGANVAASTAKGRTPLHLASDDGNVALIKLLISRGADPDAKAHNGTTPVYRAARNGSVEAVETLLMAGGKVNSVTWDNWSPLHEAIESNHFHMVEHLLSKGADTTIRTCSTTGAGLTPLDMAKFLGREEITNLLLERTDQSKGEPQDPSVTLPWRPIKRTVSGDSNAHKYPRMDTDTINDNPTA